MSDISGLQFSIRFGFMVVGFQLVCIIWMLRAILEELKKGRK